MSFHVVIIGAGPAGLVAASRLHSVGIDALVLDRGPSLQQRLSSSSVVDPYVLVNGAGGAGLFCDGKFSFWPSGTKVWQLEGSKEALVHDCSILKDFGIDCTLPSDSINDTQSSCAGIWMQKAYPSLYLNLNKRVDMIQRLLSQCQQVWFDSEVSGIRYNDGWEIDVCQNVNINKVIRAKHLVVAAGRFASVGSGLKYVIGPPYHAKTFHRIEIGVRIQDHCSNIAWSMLQGVDPKLRAADPQNDCEWRTFCCCRKGQVVAGLAEGIYALSGRADVTETDKSNIGFNLRILKDDEEESWSQELLRIVKSSTNASTFEMNVQDFLKAEQVDSLGKFLPQIQHGIQLFLSEFPSLANCSILGPTIEGVGVYPKLDDKLKVQTEGNLPIWVCGDGCGIFRGLVPAMVSGAIVARNIEWEEKECAAN